MKDNWLISILGNRIQLVPYTSRHVLKYHEWMKSEEILKLTASEPLSLEEEYEMQLSWHEDPNKCTFIILLINDNEPNEINRMIGDINIFFNDRFDRTNVEIDVMIADNNQQRKGYGKEAVYLMMNYAINSFNITRFYAKINESNVPSRSMFTKFGYKEVNYVKAFEEYEYEYVLDTDINVTNIKDNCTNYKVMEYNHSQVL